MTRAEQEAALRAAQQSLEDMAAQVDALIAANPGVPFAQLLSDQPIGEPGQGE